MRGAEEVPGQKSHRDLMAGGLVLGTAHGAKETRAQLADDPVAPLDAEPHWHVTARPRRDERYVSLATLLGIPGVTHGTLLQRHKRPSGASTLKGRVWRPWSLITRDFHYPGMVISPAAGRIERDARQPPL